MRIMVLGLRVREFEAPYLISTVSLTLLKDLSLEKEEETKSCKVRR
jgi:hypothetical protein